MRIQCRVGGRPPPDIQWYLHGQRLVQDNRHKIIVNESGCHTLLITSCQLSDTGPITCLARNRSGEAMAQVHNLIHTAAKRQFLSKKSLFRFWAKNMNFATVCKTRQDIIHFFHGICYLILVHSLSKKVIFFCYHKRRKSIDLSPRFSTKNKPWKKWMICFPLIAQLTCFFRLLV